MLELDGLSPQIYLDSPSPLAVLAIRNLLENALRHTRERTSVTLEVNTFDAMAAITVSDHGPGIPPEQLPNVTQRFWHQDGSGGSGLGLAIVQAIVLRCRGSVVFENHDNGLRVTLTLPIKHA
ncbi:ATP-binding protein [Pseudomonas putida]|nr:ATP-binding protein [Pseudomonas putida]